MRCLPHLCLSCCSLHRCLTACHSFDFFRVFFFFIFFFLSFSSFNHPFDLHQLSLFSRRIASSRLFLHRVSLCNKVVILFLFLSYLSHYRLQAATLCRSTSGSLAPLNTPIRWQASIPTTHDFVHTISNRVSPQRYTTPSTPYAIHHPPYAPVNCNLLNPRHPLFSANPSRSASTLPCSRL